MKRCTRKRRNAWPEFGEVGAKRSSYRQPDTAVAAVTAEEEKVFGVLQVQCIYSSILAMVRFKQQPLRTHYYKPTLPTSVVQYTHTQHKYNKIQVYIFEKE